MAQFKLTQGEATAISVQMKVKDACDPCRTFPLNGFQGATASFEAASGGSYHVAGTLVSSDQGRLSFTLLESDTAALASGDEQNIEIRVLLSGKLTIKQILGQLQVIEPIFP